MSEVEIGITILCILLLFFLTGIELAFAMIIMGFIGYAIVVNPLAAMAMISQNVYASTASYSLTVVPLFVLMGQVAANAGIASRLYSSAQKFIGHVPGGLALATILGGTLFKSICGSSAATTATFASVAFPEMAKRGYSQKLSTGIIACVGSIGILIPPSTVLILFGIITEQSIGKLFMAGLLPGLIFSALFVFVTVGWSKLNPLLGPKSKAYSWKSRIESTPTIIGPVIIFILIVGGLMAGIFTPTEAGSVGTFCVILLTIIQRDLNYPKFKRAVVEALRSTTMVIMLIAGSTILGRFIAVTNIPFVAADWIAGLHLHRHVVMTLIFLIYLFGGSFIDDLAFMMLATPVFFPIILNLGYDPLWAGIIICLTVVIGGVIPPVAMAVFIVKKITNVRIGIIYSGVYPYLISFISGTILLFIFPKLVTFLPGVLMK